jgi:hypothetical protein
MQRPQQTCDEKKYTQKIGILEKLKKYFEIPELRNEISKT